MNDYQKANMLLDVLLGAQGRAIWLLARVDGKGLFEIAKEHRLSIGRVREILAAADYAVDQAKLAPPEPARKPLRTNWNGFNSEDT